MVSQHPVTTDDSSQAAATAAVTARWVQAGTVLPRQQIAHAWGVSELELTAAEMRGEVFSMRIDGQPYYPSAFAALDKSLISRICLALDGLNPSQEMIFWLRSHGALGGKTIAESAVADGDIGQIEHLAREWVRERKGERATLLDPMTSQRMSSS